MGSDKIGKRAVREEQKLARREAILRAAFELFAQSTFEDVSMAAVALRAGLAKGTLYLYFETKEEMFLAVLANSFATMFDGMDRNLLNTQADDGISGVVEAFGQAILQDPNLLRLTAILHVVLERNVPRATILSFKQGMRRRLVYTGSLLEERLPFLRPGEGLRLLMTLHALMIGLQQFAYPTPVVAEVLESPGMEVFRIDYPEYLAEAAHNLIAGMAARAAAD
ncbi:MAG: TetR family transcriptional regulator [Alphaproteobacteria bacterium]|jgi:AcrR family transcriptional regulator|nr:TetR family transcriptional regulator [Rhodospirillaceae bacterium]MDP6404576.1 TetR family transcriptional regulator [Alphaproteobacteria bacterium]|tara:strand:+ start:664 stop:1335 length:672 start_codon:yes stop_codon:yes gene_type:complete